MELLKALGREDSAQAAEPEENPTRATAGQAPDTSSFMFRFGRAVDQGRLKAQRQPGQLVGSTISMFTRIMFVLLPLFALCDRNDIGGLSTPAHPDTGNPQIFIYGAIPAASA
jgi:ATP-dependent helicase YprA (DUF1998 family)